MTKACAYNQGVLIFEYFVHVENPCLHVNFVLINYVCLTREYGIRFHFTVFNTTHRLKYNLKNYKFDILP